MNDENLIPITERSESEQREMRVKGGMNSGKTRRRKKNMKQAAEILLQSSCITEEDKKLLQEAGICIEEIDAEELTNMLVVTAALVVQAKAGNVKAFRALMDVAGGDHYKNESLKLKREQMKLAKKKAEADDW